MSTQPTQSQIERQRHSEIGARFFLILLLLIVGGAILRSAIATGLDDFTIDEAYHIASGVSYVQRGDFRLNPEHPPLVKLWVGSLMSATGFHLSAFREIHDKNDERDFTEADVFLHNDPDLVQRRSRIAMWTFNGLLLIVFALAVRRAFGPTVALGTTLFPAIDPTVAAHLPVVMTDLPIALLAGCGKSPLARQRRPQGLKPALIPCALRGPEGALFHGNVGVRSFSVAC